MDGSFLFFLCDPYHKFKIVTILTTTIDETLHSRPNYDLRNLLGGTDNVVQNLIRWSTHDVLLLMEGFEPLPLPPLVLLPRLLPLRLLLPILPPMAGEQRFRN